MQTMTLRDYGLELAEVVGQLIEEGGELTEELLAKLEVAEGDFTTKAERVGLKIRELELNAALVSEEAKRLQARAKAVTNAAERLTEYLHQTMKLADKAEAKGLLMTVRVQKSTPSVRCSVPAEVLVEVLDKLAEGGDEKLLPWEGLLVEVPPSERSAKVDAKAVLAAFKAGRELPGGLEVVQGTHVRLY